MDGKNAWHEAKCVGSMTVGPRGQVVIPANVRKELGIDTGNTLLVFLDFRKRVLLVLKADTVEQLISSAGEWLASVEKLLKRTASSKTARKKVGRTDAKEKD